MREDINTQIDKEIAEEKIKDIIEKNGIKYIASKILKKIKKSC